MLHAARTEIRGPRYPVIDIHTHLSWSAQVRSGVATGEPRRFFAQAQDLLPVMDAMQVRLMVNLTGGKPSMALTGGALARLESMLPAGYEAQIDISLTDEPPLAQAIVIISARPKMPA